MAMTAMAAPGAFTPQVRPISNSRYTIYAGKTSLSSGRLVGQQQQLYSTPHAIEILFTPLTSRVTMAHRMRPAQKSIFFLQGPNVANPCLAPTPGGIACAAAARRGRLSGGFNGGSMKSYLPLSIEGLLTWFPYWATLHGPCQRTSDR